MLTILPLTPVTTASLVGFGVLTEYLRDQLIETLSPCRGVLAGPLIDDPPADYVTDNGFEGEIALAYSPFPVLPSSREEESLGFEGAALSQEPVQLADPAIAALQIELRVVPIPLNVPHKIASG
jgi:hypothetical protein